MRFLFFDEIVEVESGRRLVASKAFTLDGPYFDHHYPRRPVVPATLLIETIAQAAGWLNFISNGRRVRMVAALVENVRIHRQVRPGEVLEVEVRLLFSHGAGATMNGEARCGGEPVATVERLLFANEPVVEEEITPAEREYFRYLRQCERPAGGEER